MGVPAAGRCRRGCSPADKLFVSCTFSYPACRRGCRPAACGGSQGSHTPLSWHSSRSWWWEALRSWQLGWPASERCCSAVFTQHSGSRERNMLNWQGSQAAHCPPPHRGISMRACAGVNNLHSCALRGKTHSQSLAHVYMHSLAGRWVQIICRAWQQRLGRAPPAILSRRATRPHCTHRGLSRYSAACCGVRRHQAQQSASLHHSTACQRVGAAP